MSRSTWACELKFNFLCGNDVVNWSRSTWACELKYFGIHNPNPPPDVTLHVSVWVEIWITSLRYMCSFSHAPRERVSWNLDNIFKVYVFILSRSTWACELKFIITYDNEGVHCHAPRERVSWNRFVLWGNIRVNRHAPRERVSWNFFTHWFCKYYIGHAPRERVSWNCSDTLQEPCRFSHAPRERVSWNLVLSTWTTLDLVTLHVSVWVEIQSVHELSF